VLQILGLILIFLIFLVDNINTRFGIIYSFVGWLVLIIIYNCIAGKFTKSGGLFWQKRNVPYYLIITNGSIKFGGGVVQASFTLKYAKVLRGFFKVNSVTSRFGEYTVVIPENIVSFSELKKLIEMDRNNRDRKN